MVDSLRIYVVWAPGFAHGASIAREIARHFEALGMVRQRKRLGAPVRVRCVAAADGQPRPIDWAQAEVNVVLLLGERNLLKLAKREWKAFHDEVVEKANQPDARAHVLTLAMTKTRSLLPRLDAFQSEPFHAYRSKDYALANARGELNQSARRLLLTILMFCGGVLRQHLAALPISAVASMAVDTPIKVFLSHSRRTGRALALAINQRLTEFKPAGTTPFLDSQDLRIGQRFQEAFETVIKDGIFIAVHTDDYAQRRFCRWEIMCAKKHRRPILIAQMLNTGEERSFPYSGNTPVVIVREPSAADAEPRAGWSWFRKPADPTNNSFLTHEKGKLAVDNLLISITSEALRFLIFASHVARVARANGRHPELVLARPPELSDVVSYKRGQPEKPADAGERLLLYPDPPLDDIEMDLIEAAAGDLNVLTLSEFEAAARTNRPAAQAKKFMVHNLVGVSASNVDEEQLARIGVPRFDDRTSALWQALAEVVTVIAQAGGQIGYGGDLRNEKGITRQLFEEAADAYHQLETSSADRFVNYLAWGVWRGKDEKGGFRTPPETLFEHARSMQLLGEITIFLADGGGYKLVAEDAEGDDVTLTLDAFGGARPQQDVNSLAELHKFYQSFKFQPDDGEALTMMRRAMAREEDARIVIGGQVDGYSGRYPGVAEEAFYCIENGKLLLPLGAFGGSAHDVAFNLGLLGDDRLVSFSAVGRGFDEIMSQIASAKTQYRETLERNNVSWEIASALARTDSAQEIAELSREAFISAFSSASS